MAREWDIVVYGATGFTGRQTAAYLAEKAPADLRLAIAGRNEAGLRALHQSLNRPNVGVICADSDDAASVDAMVASTRVLATTAGPFALYGTPVVDACVRHGTHYCDITGETPWVRDMIDAHHEAARAKGTRIVPLCGFDSIPADLGTWALVQHFQATLGGSPRRVKGWYRLRGGLNGGTLASALNLNATGEVRRLARPFLLSPGHQPTPEEKAESRDPRQALRDPHWGWCSPFVMGAVNTRVVRRTSHLLAGGERAYRSGFTYQEYQGSSGGRSRWAATRDVMVLGGLLGLVSRGWGRAIAKSLGPKPGRGPGQKVIDTGGFRLDLVAEGDDGRTLWGLVKGQGDPSNTITVTCLAESALCLALEEDTLPSGGGVLTPAVAFGDVLLKRLEGTCVSVRVGLEGPHG
jgi:short subunit dehydrogenase-like uncharacterized protein